MMPEFEHNGMARCGSCGEPVCPVIIGTPANVEANPLITVRCIGCAATEAAEAITRSACND
jgi:hypothetical protein